MTLKTSSTAESIGTSEVYDNGDVMLVVGPAKDVRLRVHSQILRCSSTVFAKMFAPPWAESQSLSNDSPKDIPLPEDDGFAMRQICYVIHHQNDDVWDDLAPLQVLKIAIQAEKYDMITALKYCSAQWLSSAHRALHKVTSMLDVGRLLTSAYLFGNAEMVAAFSLRLMLDFKATDSYLGLSGESDIAHFLPWKTSCGCHHDPVLLCANMQALTLY